MSIGNRPHVLLRHRPFFTASPETATPGSLAVVCLSSSFLAQHHRYDDKHNAYTNSYPHKRAHISLLVIAVVSLALYIRCQGAWSRRSEYTGARLSLSITSQTFSRRFFA